MSARLGFARARDFGVGAQGQCLLYVLLVFLLSVPIWLIDRALDLPNQVPVDRPISAFAVLATTLAALLMAQFMGGREAAGHLLKTSFDAGAVRKPYWWLIALLLMPGLFLAQYMVLASAGSPMPATKLSIGSSALLLALLLPAAWFEELGWQGFMYPRLKSYGPLISGLVIGVAWAVWHLVPIAAAGRSMTWIAWHGLATILLRIIIVLAATRAGDSVLLATLFHASFNWGLYQFPVDGSHYNPALTSFVFALVVAALLLANKIGFVGRGNA